VTAPGRPLRFARALTPAGAPAEGVVSGGRFFQVALNYADHAAEMTLPLPQRPFVFAGLPGTAA
jgi:2-keto-4-pentenoate hydratase/2-oxohepta-3-ene-1,7-dioic acid hydratase in catechol pathway